MRKYDSIIIVLSVFTIVFITALAFSGFNITGFDVLLVNGTTTVTIATQVEISVSENDTISLGTCTPEAGGLNVTSNSSTAPAECINGDYPGYIVLRNTGNQDVSVGIDNNFTSGEFLGGTDPEIGFGIQNYSDASGCETNDTDEWWLFDAPFTQEQTFCDLFEVNQRMNVTIYMFIPDDFAPTIGGTGGMAVQFIATTL